MYSNLTGVRYRSILIITQTTFVSVDVVRDIPNSALYSLSLEAMLTCLSAMTGSESNYVLLDFACSYAISSPLTRLLDRQFFPYEQLVHTSCY